MAIQEVKERYQEQRGSTTVNGTTYTRTFIVRSDSVSEQPSAVMSASGLPDIGDGYPFDTAIKLSEKNAQPIDGESLYWLVTCVYSNVSADGTRITVVDSRDPSFLVPSVRFRAIKYIKNSDTAYNFGYDSGTDALTVPSGVTRRFPQEVVRNRAKDRYDTGLEIVKINTMINIVRNLRTVDANIVPTYSGTVNRFRMIIGGVTVKGGHGLMHEISIDPRWDNRGVKYWTTEYNIEVDAEGHQAKLPNIGFNELDTTTGKLKRIKRVDPDTEEEYFITEPAWLDSNGRYVDITDPAFGFYYNYFYPYWAEDWRPLGLPQRA